MKIQTCHAGIGSQVFMSRLTKYLGKNFDVKIVKSRPDIYLSAVWSGSIPSRCRHVHRVDGCYFDRLNKSAGRLNSRLAKDINRASAIVWQSKYSRKLCKGILNVNPKNSRVIYNGIDQSIYDDIEPEKLGFEILFVACAKWRPLKRPKSIAKGFLRAEIPNSGLVMIGKVGGKERIKDKRIKYLGAIKSKETYKYYKAANAIIHISRMDACPNVVVEALGAGKPVICNNVSGTPELVKDDGIILDIDPPLNYKPFKMKKPDSVSSSVIADGLRRCVEKEWNINRPDLSMDHCAKKYYEYFEDLLK